MPIDIPIPAEAAHIIAAIVLHENGTVAIHYAQTVAIGGILVNGRTIVGDPFTGPFQIDARVIMFEAARKARHLGALVAPDRAGLPELPAGPIRDHLERQRMPALPPIPGYRDPAPPAPRLMSVAALNAAPPEALPDEDATAKRFSLLELDQPKALTAGGEARGGRCDSCGMVGAHAPDCNRCPSCGAADRGMCECP